MKRALLTVLCLGMQVVADPAVPPARVLPKVAFTLADFVAQTPRSATGSYLMEVPEIVNLSLSEEARAVLEGKVVETNGQVTEANGQMVIERAVISCCASHAKWYKLGLRNDRGNLAIADKAWVSVIGTITFVVEGEAKVPMILVREVVPSLQPKNALAR